jgi:hypothetical protein
LTYPNKKYITTVTVKVKLKMFPQNWLYWEGFRSFFALNCVCITCEKVFKIGDFLTGGAFFATYCIIHTYVPRTKAVLTDCLRVAMHVRLMGGVEIESRLRKIN